MRSWFKSISKEKFEVGKGAGDAHGPILPYNLTDVEFQRRGIVMLRTFPELAMFIPSMEA